MKYNLLYINLLLLLVACSPVTDSVDLKEENYDFQKIWRLSEIDNPNAKPMTLLEEAEQNEQLKKGHLLSFFPDHTFSEIVGNNYAQGRWKYLFEKQCILRISNTKNDTLSILDFNKKGKKQFLKIAYPKYKAKAIFLKDADMLERPKQDPFHPENNRWRIKPDGEETELELKKRLSHYITHMAYLLKASTERSQKVVSFEFSQGIVKIYNGGIGVITKSRVSQDWINCFYSEDQAFLVRKMYSDYLRKGSYKGATTGSWVKDDYNILISLLKQIQDSIDE